MIKLSTPIVSAEWLHQNRYAENLIILDGTINKVFNSTQFQIPNARLFDIKKKFSDSSNPFPSAFPSKDQFQSEARALGINNNSAIVVYDDKGIYSSARVWWMFLAFGFSNVAVLNGGFPAWNKEGFATESMTNYQSKKGNFDAVLHSNYMQFFDAVKQASEDNTHTIIDARSSSRFQCQEPEPRQGLRMGTIPNSVSLPFTDLMEDGMLKPKGALEKAFYMLAQKDDAIIFSCGSGITACVLALGATIAGYNNISVYDGSWTEWGSLVKA
ncbi:sulfurtransferase [uncultured Algibacter sp.]|uniref:sulfurtransferase n=1 Tax=uncultured Algibacter sp. TaxID=298659 RepID=UPI00263626B7|nr:sulfurtransferase [uncultured Algibacter sp.]